MSLEDAGDLLRRHRLRSTPQRRAILQVFGGSGDEHLSAEEVLARASVTVPDLGRGTVYATLAELSEVGVLGSVGTSEPVRYETNVLPHDHFHCSLCQRLFDVDLGGPSRRWRLAGFSIESVAVRAEGVCADCHAFREGVADGAARALTEPTLLPDALERLTCLRAESPVGVLGLAASREGIVRVAFEDHADFGAIDTRARTRRGSTSARTRCRDLQVTLERYFGGDREPPTDIIDWSPSGPLNKVVLRAAQRIAYGTSLSYDRLGGELSARDCGRLMGGNVLALLIPSHRVSCGSERLEAYVGGATRLRAIRALEAGGASAA
jgi:Fe2+ or Zn2+ uptake regulation protein/O6-methylguanine-DNA--protein-cysteine methyltransferase